MSAVPSSRLWSCYFTLWPNVETGRNWKCEILTFFFVPFEIYTILLWRINWFLLKRVREVRLPSSARFKSKGMLGIKRDDRWSRSDSRHLTAENVHANTSSDGWSSLRPIPDNLDPSQTNCRLFLRLFLSATCNQIRYALKKVSKIDKYMVKREAKMWAWRCRSVGWC